MTENDIHTLAEIFDECLTKIEAGQSIEEALASYPDRAEALEPLLRTAGAARDLYPARVPRAAVHRGRTRALVHAARLRKGQRRGRTGWSLRRFALQLSAVILVFAVSLTSLVAASAESLPGDSLYALKRAAEAARLNVASESARSSFEESLRVRRIDEIEELLRKRRSAPVNFEGVVTAAEGSTWEIAGLAVTIRPEAAITGDILPGMYVEVFGRTLSTGELIADQIFLRAYAFTGLLESASGSIWLVDGVPILITDETQLAPDIAFGDPVVVLAAVDNEGTISARAILLGQAAQPDETPEETVTPGEGTPTPVQTPAAEQSDTPDPEADPEAVETEDVFETEDEMEEPEETEDETEEPEETEDETEEPEETEDETEEPEETEDDDDNSGSGSEKSGSGSGEEEPDDD